MPNFQEQLTAALAPGLRIDREIGGGGMSRVFVATEIALGRFVAVKVLLPELAHGISVERFRREVTVSARLQHPHIVPLLAAGEALGLPYYTMPLVEGESLRARLNRNGPLAVPDAIRLLREVASALGYAHGKGVVHRDIKPENILLTGSHAMVTDFGIAKALSVATERDRPVQTEFGATLGTPAYMAPEQVVGDASIDHRADLYALGTVAYEVLCGRTPFGNRPPAAMLGAQVSEAPESIAQACAGTPPRLAALVMRCLEKRPGDRPPSSDDLLRELEASSGPDPTPERPARVSIAVLPMVNTSGDVESEPFSDGLTDELIGALGKVESLTVSGRTSTFALKGKGLEIAQIAAHLRVNHLLEGSVRRSGQRLRIRVQLVDAEGRILWSDVYDRKVEDVFAIQEEIAQAVVRALEVQFETARGPLVRPPTTDLSAYELYLKGRFVRRRMSADALARSIEYLEEALRLDSTFAPALAWLSDAHWLLVVIAGRSPVEEVPRARAYAARAIELDPQLAEAHWAMSQVQMADWNWPAAERGFLEALRLDPGLVDARHLYALFLLHQGRVDEAIVDLTRVLTADPLHAEAHFTMGRAHLARGDSDRAVASFREASGLQPAFIMARSYLGHAHLQAGRVDEAMAEHERAAANGTATEVAQLAYMYGIAGRRVEATGLIDRLLADADHLSLFHLAMAYVGLGDVPVALDWLERSCEAHDPWTTALKIHPAFGRLRHEPRFTELLTRMRLPI